MPMIGRFFRRHDALLKAFQRLALFFVLALVIAGPAAGGPEHELRQNIITVIKDQLAAFQRDDGKTAFAYASPDVQDQFGTPEAYLAQFAVSYKAVYRPRHVTFLNLAYSRGRLVQRVLVVGPDGSAMVALFPMMQMTDGTWRVDGVVLVPANGKSAEGDPEPFAKLDAHPAREVATLPE
jgi:hypothetical protein